MSSPPFTMSKYATELDLLRDKCAWQEAELAKMADALTAVDVRNIVHRLRQAASDTRHERLLEEAADALAKALLHNTFQQDALDRLRAVTGDYKCPACGRYGFASAIVSDRCTACANDQRAREGEFDRVAYPTNERT